MAVTVEGSGTQTCVIGTEHTLDTITQEGVFIFEIDTAAMAAGDILEIRIKNAILASGTVRVVHYAMFAGAQLADDVIKTSVPFTNDAVTPGPQVSIKQLTGTGRAFPWVVRKL